MKLTKKLMENYFECIYEDIGGYCILTYEFINDKIKCKPCNKCGCFNNCKACICPKIFKEKDYCKDCINNKTKGEKNDWIDRCR